MSVEHATDDLIVASWDVPPERPELRLRIDQAGAVRSAGVMRWDDGGHGLHRYVPCGATVGAECRFGDLVILSHVTVGWWFDTPRYEPFFEASVLDAQAID